MKVEEYIKPENSISKLSFWVQLFISTNYFGNFGCASTQQNRSASKTRRSCSTRTRARTRWSAATSAAMPRCLSRGRSEAVRFETVSLSIQPLYLQSGCQSWEPCSIIQISWIVYFKAQGLSIRTSRVIEKSQWCVLNWFLSYIEGNFGDWVSQVRNLVI